MGSLSPVLAARTASKPLTPIIGICSHNGRHQCNFSNGYTGRRCEWRRCLSFCSDGREASALKRPPSALLNAAEYRKRKAEQKEEEDENDEDDDELCPVECVREFKTNSELQTILQHAKLTNTLVVVDFYRTACGSCRYIEKGFIKLCKGAGNGAVSVIFLKHNVWSSNNLFPYQVFLVFHYFWFFVELLYHTACEGLSLNEFLVLRNPSQQSHTWPSWVASTTGTRGRSPILPEIGNVCSPRVSACLFMMSQLFISCNLEPSSSFC